MAEDCKVMVFQVLLLTEDVTFMQEHIAAEIAAAQTNARRGRHHHQRRLEKEKQTEIHTYSYTHGIGWRTSGSPSIAERSTALRVPFTLT